jgi:CRISPR-associated protein Csb1
LLDSVQSQANRLEQALRDAFQAAKLNFPLLSVDFSKDLPDVGEITALDAPHRIADAIFRDSTLNGKPFRPQLKAGGKKDTAEVSEEGKRFAEANVRNATPLFELCPTALIFGVWDSTGATGGLGNKFARIIVSEIVGVQAVKGVRTSSRLDPTGITDIPVYQTEEGDWTADRAQAAKDSEGTPVPFARKNSSKDKGKPSEINHSNVTPDIVVHESELDPETRRVVKKGNETLEMYAPLRVGGGVTVAYAEQTTVLSLAGLRRLRFPLSGKASSPETDHAARTVLAALALAAVAHQMDPPDYFLRSNCQLVLDGDPEFELIRTAKDLTRFTLRGDEADKLFAEATQEAMKHQLPWRAGKIPLHPKAALVDLVKRSRELRGEERG